MDVSLESSPVCSPSPAKEVPMSPLSCIYASLKWTFFSVQKWENWWYKAAHSRRQTFCESLKMSNISVQILCHMGARVWCINKD